jgi:hypothetical protein
MLLQSKNKNLLLLEDIKMTLTKREQDLIADNLRAYLTHFIPVRIEREDYGKGFYVFQEDQISYVQFCYDIHYLNGWLYGAVQSKCKVIKEKEED